MQPAAGACSNGCLTGISFSALIVAVVAFIIAVVGVVELEDDSDDDSEQAYDGDVILSSSPDPVDGHEYFGALFAGSGEWLNKPRTPDAMSDHVTIAAGETFFVVGGLNEIGTVRTRVDVFDTVSEAFEPQNLSISLPVGRARFAGCAHGEHLLITGGFEDLDSDPVSTTLMLSLETDGAGASGWVAGPPLTLGPRGDLVAVATSLGTLAIGGYGPGYDMTETGTRVELLRFGETSWEPRAAMPTSRGDVTAAYDSGDAPDFSEEKVFVVGGWNDATPEGQFLSVVELYFVREDAWIRLPEMPRAKGDAAAGVQQGQLVVVGGEVWSGRTGPCSYAPELLCNLNEIPTHDVVSLDLEPLPRTFQDAADRGLSSDDDDGVPTLSSGLAWVHRSPIPEPLFRFSAVEVDGVLWVVGGQKHNGAVQQSVMAYYDVRHPIVYAHRRVASDEEDD